MSKTKIQSAEIERILEKIKCDNRKIIPQTKEKSPQSKEKLGIPPGRIVTWVPLDTDERFHEIILNAAKYRNISVKKMLKQMLFDYLSSPEIYSKLEDESNTYILRDYDIEDLDSVEKELNKIKERLNRNKNAT